MALSMVSLFMFAFNALVTTSRKREFELSSEPPMRAATVISRINFVNILPRFASCTLFLNLIFAHLL